MEPVVDCIAYKTILKFLNIFSKLDILNKIQCNRCSNFLFRSFEDFFPNLDIVLEFSSSYQDSSNPAERVVKTVKNIIKKCTDEKLGSNVWRIGLIDYFCAPISEQLPTLAEILNSHIYKGYQPFFFILLLGLSQSMINLLKGRKNRNFTMIYLFQIIWLLLMGKMFGIETILRIFGKKQPSKIGMTLQTEATPWLKKMARFYLKTMLIYNCVIPRCHIIWK